jgi:hypothetical protein
MIRVDHERNIIIASVGHMLITFFDQLFRFIADHVMNTLNPFGIIAAFIKGR